MCSLLVFLLQRVKNVFSPPAHLGERKASRNDTIVSTIGHSRSAATGYSDIDPVLDVDMASLSLTAGGYFANDNVTPRQELAGITKDKETSRGPPRVKDNTVAKQREQLTLDVTARRNVEWKEESQKKLNKISAIQEIAQKLEATRSRMSDRLVQQSDRLSDMMNSLTNEKQTMLQVLADEEKINDKLQADIALDDAKDISQQKLEWFSDEQKLANGEEEISNLKDQIRVKGEMMRVKDNVLVKFKQDLEEYQKVTCEQSVKILTLQKEVAEKEKKLAVTREEITDLNDQLAKQSDLLSAEMANKWKIQNDLAGKEMNRRVVEGDKEMYKAQLNAAEDLIQQLKMEQSSLKQQLADMEAMKVEALAELKEEMIVKQNSLDVTVSRHSDELEEWQKEGREQLDKISALQQEVEEKGEELVTTTSEISNLYHQLVQQSDLLSAAMTKEQAFHSILADKERIIDQLQSDIEMYSAKLNDVKDSMQQLKIQQLVEKDELEKEMMEKIRAKDEALAELKEQLIAKQKVLDAAVSKHSVELTEWEKQSEEQSDKIVTLQQEVAEKEEELVATRNEMTDVNDELTQQSDLLSAEVAYTQTLKHTLADKERIIEQLNKDIATHQTEINNIKSHMSELEKGHFSVKQELAENKKEIMEKYERKAH